MSKKRDDNYYDEYEEDYTDESEDDFSVHFFSQHPDDTFDIPHSDEENEEEEEEEEEEPNEGILSKAELDKLLSKKKHTIPDRIAIVRHYWESDDDDEFRRRTVSKELRDFFKTFFERYGVDYDEHLVERTIRAFFVRVQREGENIIEKLRDILNRTKDNSKKKDYGGMMRKAVLTADAGLLLSTVYEVGKFTKKNQKYQAKAYAKGVIKPSRGSTKQANPEARHLPLKQRRPIEEKRREIAEAKRQSDLKDMFRREKAGKSPFSGGGGGKGRPEKEPYKRAPNPKTRVLEKSKGKGKAPPLKRPPRPPSPPPSLRPPSDSDLSSIARDHLFNEMIAGPSSRPVSVQEYRSRADRWSSGGGGGSSSLATAAEEDDDSADDSLWKQAREAAKKNLERQAAAEEAEKKRKREQEERFQKKKEAYQNANRQETEDIRRRLEEKKRREEERKREEIQDERKRARDSR